MDRDQIKQILIDHGVTEISGALLDALAGNPADDDDAEAQEIGL